MPIATCEQCGKPFEGRDRPDRANRFCSRTCFYEHGRQEAASKLHTLKCQWCGNPFTYKPQNLAVYRRRYGKDPQYCSTDCAGAARKGHRKPPLTEKICKNPECGKTFAVRRQRELSQEYCSKSCMTTYEAIYGRLRAQQPRKTREDFICQNDECRKTFSYTSGTLAEYRKKHGHDPKYCSIQCSGIGRAKDNEKRQTFVCEECGKTQLRSKYQTAGRVKYYSQQRFCGHDCKVNWQMRQTAARFESGDIGRHVKRHGYVWISIPANIAGGKKTEMLEHRWVMQQSLGRKLLREETVHHIDGNRQNNAIENLELFRNRHGPGQRVIDIVAFAIDILRLYPEFAARAGVKLIDATG